MELSIVFKTTKSHTFQTASSLGILFPYHHKAKAINTS